MGIRPYEKRRRLFAVFYFTLRSVVDYFVIIFINQIAYKHKLIPFVFKAFEDIWECRRCVVGIVMEKNNTAVFNLARHTLTNAVGCGSVFPVKAVNIRNKSNILIRACKYCPIMLKYIKSNKGALIRCFG